MVLYLTMWAALLIVCGFAFKGRWPERVVAAAMLAGSAVGGAQLLASALGWIAASRPSREATLALDIIFLSIFVAVAVRARPNWTLFAAAFQLLATLSSVVHLSAGAENTLAYATAQNTLWWLTLFSLAYGVWEAAAAKRATG